MKKFIIMLVVAITFIVGIVYFVFSSDKTLSLTYIKFNVNPEFIIGINSNEQVSIFNPLNEEAKVFNLGMFNGKSLEDTTKIILETLKNKDYLDDGTINITVISKNPSKIEHYYQKINSVVLEEEKEIILVNKRASNDELLAYSNEVAYDIKSTYTEEDLKSISSNIEEQIKNYLDAKLVELKMEKLTIEEKELLITEKQNEGYFNDYELLYYEIVDYSLKMIEGSDYEIEFIYEEDVVKYNITLNLILEFSTNKEIKDINYNVVEEYLCNYNNGEIKTIKNNFYKYS